jgi:hypothetical protein
MPWRDSISRPIAPVSSVAGGADTTAPRREGTKAIFLKWAHPIGWTLTPKCVGWGGNSLKQRANRESSTLNIAETSTILKPVFSSSVCSTKNTRKKLLYCHF